MGRRQYKRTHFSTPEIDIEKLYVEIAFLIQQAQLYTLQITHLTALNLHRNIGKLIVDAEFGKNRRMEDHQELLFQLSRQLVKKFGEEIDCSNLEDCCKFYLVYPPAFETQRISSKTVEIPQLQVPPTWDHYRLLIHISYSKDRNFMKKRPVIAIGFLACLKNLLKIACLKGFPSAQTKKAYIGLFNKEVW
jgi:hypothetical protein